MSFLSAGWLWLYVGILIMLAEFVVPGFIIFFFGLAAVTVGGLVLLLPASFSPDLTWQLALFSFFTILYLITLRRYAKTIFLGDFGSDGACARIGDDFVGRLAQVTVALEPGLVGRVMLGDAQWSARADTAIAVGETVKIIARDNLTLLVEAV